MISTSLLQLMNLCFFGGCFVSNTLYKLYCDEEENVSTRPFPVYNYILILKIIGTMDKFIQLEKDLEEVNLQDLMTSNEEFDNIKLYDSTIEVIGFVDGIEASRLVGDKQQFKVFKFFLNNGLGKRVQVVAWNDIIDKIECQIKTNYITHLDGVQARTPKISHFNSGNVSYELQILPSSIVNVLGKYEPINTSNVNPLKVILDEVLNTSGCIQVQAYIKTNFTEVFNNLLKTTIGCGSITDGIFKLEVHILNFEEEEYIALNLNKGDQIQLIGNMNNKAGSPYLIVNGIDNITKLEGRLPFTRVLRGNKLPQKRKLDEN